MPVATASRYFNCPKGRYFSLAQRGRFVSAVGDGGARPRDLRPARAWRREL